MSATAHSPLADLLEPLISRAGGLEKRSQREKFRNMLRRLCTRLASTSATQQLAVPELNLRGIVAGHGSAADIGRAAAELQDHVATAGAFAVDPSHAGV